jgi:hypothetical protein
MTPTPRRPRPVTEARQDAPRHLARIIEHAAGYGAVSQAAALKHPAQEDRPADQLTLMGIS